MTSEACQVCGGTAFAETYRVRDTNQDVPGEWTIETCAACGLGRLSPMPSAAQVATFYRDVFYAEDGERFRPWMENMRRGLSGSRAFRLMLLRPRPGRLLDFGAGAGHFAAFMRSRRWAAVAFDPFSAASEGGALEDGSERISVDCADGHYDAITLWYVIEHLRDPRGAIREFHRALRPGGMLVLATQDFASVQARIFGTRWLFLDPPRHLFQFSAATLSRMAEQEGFVVRHRSSASLEMGPFTILQSLLNVIVGNDNYLFRFLKSRALTSGSAGGGRLGPTLLSVLLLPLVGPVALVLYFVWLARGSGDVFTLYLERR